MANENTNVNQETENTEIDYISAINELKANTVDREKYNKLKDENKRLLDTLVSGGQIEQDKVETVSADDLRSKLYGNGHENLSNLEYWTNTLKLRELIMEEGKPDPFTPQGKQIMATDTDRATAQKVADVVQHCIDVAEGDSLVFTNELQRMTADISPISTRRRK